MTARAIHDALTTAMKHSVAPMALSDPALPDCPLVAVNQAFSDLTGYPHAELVGRNCRFLQGPKTDPISPRRIRTCLEAGSGCIEWIVNYRRDGSAFYNLLFISPVRDLDGELLYFFGNQLDITHGMPHWLPEVSIGSAHVVPALEHEFHALLREVDLAAKVEALQSIVDAAHRLAEISVRLEPGTLQRLALVG